MGPEQYIGLMSGTSIDSIDAVLIESTDNQFKLLQHHSEEIPQALRKEITALCCTGAEEIERLGVLDRKLGGQFAQAALGLLQKAACPSEQITAIGSHGQTIRHRPPQPGRPTNEAFTLQIGDPTTIAELTGITTIADFRRRDIAAGGQGAPLVPLFHQACFTHKTRNRAIVNIGGMANISLLSAKNLDCGYDTGPGNVLLDYWIQQQLDRPYDKNGEWAASGTVDSTLLEQLLAHPYFALHIPKSTGREDFNGTWLEEVLAGFEPKAAADVQATLLELTARSLSHAVNAADVDEVFLCGGGAHNGALVSRIQSLVNPRQVESTEVLGIEPDWVEASAFAWLARQCKHGRAGSDPAVTGARGKRVLGAIYQA